MSNPNVLKITEVPIENFTPSTVGFRWTPEGEMRVDTILEISLKGPRWGKIEWNLVNNKLFYVAGGFQTFSGLAKGKGDYLYERYDKFAQVMLTLATDWRKNLFPLAMHNNFGGFILQSPLSQSRGLTGLLDSTQIVGMGFLSSQAFPTYFDRDIPFPARGPQYNWEYSIERKEYIDSRDFDPAIAAALGAYFFQMLTDFDTIRQSL